MYNKWETQSTFRCFCNRQLWNVQWYLWK